MITPPDISRREFIVGTGRFSAALGIVAVCGNLLPQAAAGNGCIVIGAGSRGECCLNVLLQCRYPVAALYDKDTGRGERLSRGYGIPSLDVAAPDRWAGRHPFILAVPSSEVPELISALKMEDVPVLLDFSTESSVLHVLRILAECSLKKAAAVLTAVSPATEGLRRFIAQEDHGPLQRIHCSQGCCAPALLLEKHVRSLFMILSLCSNDEVSHHFSVYSGCTGGQSDAYSTLMSSLSFASGLQAEFITTTADTVPLRMTFRGEKKRMRLDVASCAAAMHCLSMEEVRIRSIHDWCATWHEKKCLESTPTTHATLLLSMLQQLGHSVPIAEISNNIIFPTYTCKA